jgi:hypothetical protein
MPSLDDRFTQARTDAIYFGTLQHRSILAGVRVEFETDHTYSTARKLAAIDKSDRALAALWAA